MLPSEALDPAEEAMVLDRFGSSLRTEDHIRRLDRLLWDNKTADAARMLSRVPSDWKTLAEARMKLAAGAKNAEAAAAKVPRSLAGDPGLAFERMKYRRHKGQDDAAAQILESQAELAPTVYRKAVN